MIFLQVLPNIQDNEDLGLKSFLVFMVVILISAIVYLFKNNKSITEEHKTDLKSFDIERSKTVAEQLQMLNKIAFSLEKNSEEQVDVKRTQKEVVKSLNELILIAESVKNKIDERT